MSFKAHVGLIWANIYQLLAMLLERPSIPFYRWVKSQEMCLGSHGYQVTLPWLELDSGIWAPGHHHAFLKVTASWHLSQLSKVPLLKSQSTMFSCQSLPLSSELSQEQRPYGTVGTPGLCLFIKYSSIKYKPGTRLGLMIHLLTSQIMDPVLKLYYLARKTCNWVIMINVINHHDRKRHRWGYAAEKRLT